MRLSLSSGAAPDAEIDGLLEACRRRGFAGVELEAGHAHGLTGADPAAARRVRARLAEGGVDVVGFRTPASLSGDVAVLAAFGQALEAPVVLVPAGESVDAFLEALEAAGALAAGGARALVSLDGVSAETSCVADLVGRLDGAALDVGVAWEVDPERGQESSRTAHQLVERLGRSLRLIRLRGGGPETQRQEGLGVGALMGTLALSGYDGPLVLAPTSPRYRVAWSAWLGRRGGWGCGSRTADPELVRLVREPLSPGGAG